MNELIQTIFQEFEVNDTEIPVKFLYYQGHGEPYITYMEMDKSNSFSGDDSLLGYVHYYDFDIYSKGNLFPIIERVKELLEENDFVFQPSKCSADLFEHDTGYYHKTLNFAYMTQEV